MPLRAGRELRNPVELSTDVVIVGTGAGGGMALHDATLGGLHVIALEEGDYRDSASFRGDERAQLSALYQDGAGRTTEDGAIAILQGRGVGGSTVHNTNLCKRTPFQILNQWSERLGLDSWHPDRIVADFAAVEELLHVAPIEPGRVNRNNAMLQRGMEALGWRGGVMSHNRRGCVGSGLCELGCPFNAKENVLKTLLPPALARGATVWSGVRVERVLVEGGRAVGVAARALIDGQPGPAMTVRARAVVLAGSAIGSAALALQSRLPDPHSMIGGNLHLHPGAAVAGFFDQPIEGWSGIPQSVECTELIDWEPGSPRRIWIVPAFAHPIGMASATPGFGAAHMQALRRYPYMAVLVAMLHDESSGRVTVRSNGRPRIDYRLIEADARALAQGMAACARLLLAAGAREVMAPTTPAMRLTRDSDLAALASYRVRAFDPQLTAVHPMSTLPMALDPARGVTDGAGRFHGVPGLYVADGSLFPTSIGAPPQISIYTAGRRTARTVLSDLARER